MSEKNFDRAFQFVARWEGWSKADDVDPGGETILGISERAHPQAYNTIAKIVAEKGRNAAVHFAREFYHAEYWTRLGADKLPSGYDLFIFDTAVNMGVKRAARIVQRAVGAKPDGVIGPKSIVRIRTAGRSGLIYAARLRIQGYLRIVRRYPERAVYLNGWLNRVLDCMIEVGELL